MGLFRKKKEQASYDSQSKRPVIKCSICRGKEDMKAFREKYGIPQDAEINKIY